MKKNNHLSDRHLRRLQFTLSLHTKPFACMKLLIKNAYSGTRDIRHSKLHIRTISQKYYLILIYQDYKTFSLFE